MAKLWKGFEDRQFASNPRRVGALGPGPGRSCRACRLLSGSLRYQSSKAPYMSLFVWLTLGVVTGYLGSLIMRFEPDQGAFVTTGAGILGALLTSWLLAPLLGQAPDRDFFSATAVAIALLGAVVVVALVNFLRYRRIR